MKKHVNNVYIPKLQKFIPRDTFIQNGLRNNDYNFWFILVLIF